jgi:type II secretion system protein J
MSPTRRGFTLLEVLVACALLAVVSTMAFSWISSQSRASHNAKARLDALAAAETAMRLIQEDLSFAVVADATTRFVLMDEHTIRMTTLSRLPGEGPGFHRVIWQWLPQSHQLQRGLGVDQTTLKTAPRLVTSRLKALTFSITDQGRLMASISLSDNPADDLLFPLGGAGS